ncbi:MAG TPA: hypothetical protein VGH38_02285 [Bryobacteraceae bacterium]
MIGLLGLAGAGQAQRIEAAGNAGFGIVDRNGFGRPTAVLGGVTIGWPYSATQRVQFDYALNHFERECGGCGSVSYNRHFFTGSYVIEPRARVRPFLQIGAGVQYETNNGNQVIRAIWPAGGIRDTDAYDFRTVFAGVLGAGLTVQLGHSAFIRPQIRAYLAPGPVHSVNLTAMPAIGMGWRF